MAASAAAAASPFTAAASAAGASAPGATGTVTASAAGASAPVHVATTTGAHTITPTLRRDGDLLLPPCRDPTVIQPFADVASAALIAVPATSAAKISGAARRFKEVMTVLGITGITFVAVLIYIVARCCPPPDSPRPPCCASPVLPTTVAGDVDALRRGADLGVEGLAAFGDALRHAAVSALLRAIGARVKRLKTSKVPLLYQEVAAFWRSCRAKRTAVAARDGFAVVVGFFFGMRVSELLALGSDDVSYVTISSDGGTRGAMRIVFRQTKTRRSLFISHDPFAVTCGHDLLMEAWAFFEEYHDFHPGAPVFHRTPGPRGTRDKLSRDWFANLVAAAAPKATPHSCRVGLATEMWAAGRSIEEVMSVGRWSSVAALLYVVGALEDQVKATDAIGSAGALRMSNGDLRKAGMTPGAGLRGPGGPSACSKAWNRIAARVPEPDDD